MKMAARRRMAVALASGGPVLFVYEKLTSAKSALDAIGATAWPEEDLTGGLGGARLLEIIAAEPALATVDVGSEVIT
jgi:hypothetical protein